MKRTITFLTAGFLALSMLSGCTTTDSAESETPNAEQSESANPEVESTEENQSPIAPTIDYTALMPSELLALGEDNVIVRDREEFEQALINSIAKSELEGLVESSKIADGVFTTVNYIPGGKTSGVTFVLDEEDKAFEDSILLVEKTVLNLPSLKRSLEANAFAGFVKQPNGEIILKLVPGGESGESTFVYVVFVGEEGYITNLISTGNHEEVPRIVETEVTYGETEQSIQMLSQLSTSS